MYASKGEEFIPLLLKEGAATVPQIESLSISRRTNNDWVKLNVGGQLFYTTRTTLLNREPCSMLAKMFDPASRLQPGTTDSDGAYLIDRDPKYFRPLLNYLRDGELVIDADVNVKGIYWNESAGTMLQFPFRHGFILHLFNFRSVGRSSVLRLSVMYSTVGVHDG